MSTVVPKSPESGKPPDNAVRRHDIDHDGSNDCGPNHDYGPRSNDDHNRTDF